MAGIITRLMEPRTKAQPPGPYDDYWYKTPGPEAQSGIAVSPEIALTIPTVYACVKVLAEAHASLPLIVYERLTDGGKQRATNHPLYTMLHDQPNS